MSSCFNNLKAPKETTVSFYIDEATVNKILQKSGRAAADIYDSSNVYIDVTLCSDVEQTKTDAFSSDVKIEFQNILVGTRVYAKAQILEEFLFQFRICSVSKKQLKLAFSSMMSDFEDSVHSFCAKNYHIPYIITRNTKDYKLSPIKAIEPKDFLLLMQ